MKDERGSQTITVYEHSGTQYMSLREFIARLQEALEATPPEYRDQVEVAISASTEWDSPYPTIEATYDRPETEREYAERLAQADADRRARIAEEREIYERLKRKYG